MVELLPYESGILDEIVFKITNNGLIAAQDARIALPQNHPFLVFTAFPEDIGVLPAAETVEVSSFFFLFFLFFTIKTLLLN